MIGAAKTRRVAGAAEGLGAHEMTLAVPADMIRKIKMLLMLRHPKGCSVYTLHDDYLTYTGHDIKPAHYNYETMEDFVKRGLSQTGILLKKKQFVQYDGLLSQQDTHLCFRSVMNWEQNNPARVGPPGMEILPVDPNLAENLLQNILSDQPLAIQGVQHAKESLTSANNGPTDTQANVVVKQEIVTIHPPRRDVTVATADSSHTESSRRDGSPTGTNAEVRGAVMGTDSSSSSSDARGDDGSDSDVEIIDEVIKVPTQPQDTLPIPGTSNAAQDTPPKTAGGLGSATFAETANVAENLSPPQELDIKPDVKLEINGVTLESEAAMPIGAEQPGPNVEETPAPTERIADVEAVESDQLQVFVEESKPVDLSLHNLQRVQVDKTDASQLETFNILPVRFERITVKPESSSRSQPLPKDPVSPATENAQGTSSGTRPTVTASEKQKKTDNEKNDSAPASTESERESHPEPMDVVEPEMDVGHVDDDQIGDLDHISDEEIIIDLASNDNTSKCATPGSSQATSELIANLKNISKKVVESSQDDKSNNRKRNRNAANDETPSNQARSKRQCLRERTPKATSPAAPSPAPTPKKKNQPKEKTPKPATKETPKAVPSSEKRAENTPGKGVQKAPAPGTPKTSSQAPPKPTKSLRERSSTPKPSPKVTVAKKPATPGSSRSAATPEPVASTSRGVPAAAGRPSGNSPTNGGPSINDPEVTLTTVDWVEGEPSCSKWDYDIVSSSKATTQNGKTFLDLNTNRVYIPNIDVDTLQKARSLKKDPDHLCYHPFWSVTPLCKSSKDFQYLKTQRSDVQIPPMSFAAFQLANLDADFNYELSSSQCNDTLTFMTSYDGFHEYFLWKMKDKCRGFGLMPPSEECEVSSNFVDDDNFVLYSDKDIFSRGLKDDFKEIVLSSSSSSADVDVFVANGIEYPGMKLRSQDLCLVQCLLALELLREGGTFVLKLEDTLTCFGVGLIFLLSRCFPQLTIHKPVSALPGERFLVCRWKKIDEESKDVKKFLAKCFRRIMEFNEDGRNNKDEISRLFGSSTSHMILSLLDRKLLNYIKNKNKKIGEDELNEYKEFKMLAELFSGVTNPDAKQKLVSKRLVVRNNFWRRWDNNYQPLDAIVDNMGKHFDQSKPGIHWRTYLTSYVLERGEKSVRTATTNASPPVGAQDQWKFIFSSGNKNRFLFVALDDGVHKYVSAEKKWVEVQDLKLTSGTILYGELMTKSSPTKVLNIIDAARIAGNDISDRSLADRRNECLKFAMGMDMPFNDVYRVICPRLNDLSDLPAGLMEIAELKGNLYLLKDTSNSVVDALTAASSGQRGSQSKGKCVGFQPSEVLLLKTNRVPHQNSIGTCDFAYLVKSRLFWEWIPRADMTQAGISMTSMFDNKDDATILFEYLASEAKN